METAKVVMSKSYLRVLLMPTGAAKLEAETKSKHILMTTYSLPNSHIVLNCFTFSREIQTHGSSSKGRRINGDV